MTASSANSSSINNSARCNHRFPNGMRCRLIGFAGQPFCPRHSQPVIATLPDPASLIDSTEVAATLTANLDDFTDPEQINTFLSRLLLLLAQQKISTRQAAVLTYIASQLLRTLPAIQKQNDGPPTIIYASPRPDRRSPEEKGAAASTANPTASAPEVHPHEVRK